MAADVVNHPTALISPPFARIMFLLKIQKIVVN